MSTTTINKDVKQVPYLLSLTEETKCYTTPSDSDIRWRFVRGHLVAESERCRLFFIRERRRWYAGEQKHRWLHDATLASFKITGPKKSHTEIPY